MCLGARKIKNNRKPLWIREVSMTLVIVLMTSVFSCLGTPKAVFAEEKIAVELHGDLAVEGTKLVDEDGEVFQLRGISSHGINWDVGQPTWSQDVDIASKSPIKKQENIMYTVHFYAATHKDSYREKVKTAVKNGLPVICTEFSGCEASGNGYCDYDSAEAWLEMMDSLDISYVCWSLSNKDESASLLKASCKKTSGFKNSDLSEMGKWIKKWYNTHK